MRPPPECQALGSDWPQWAHDAGHSGYNPRERVLGPSNVGQLNMQWMLYTPSSPYFAVANRILYTVGDYGLGPGLYALDAITGPASIWWVVPIDLLDDSCFRPEARLAVDHWSVYLGCGGSFYVIGAFNGAILYRDHFEPFTVADGALYGTGWQYVTGWQLFTGPRWLFEINLMPGCLDELNFCTPSGFSVMDNGVPVWRYSVSYYQGGYGAGLFAVNASDGSPLWNFQFDGSCQDELTAANGVLYAVCNGSLNAFGEQSWSLPGLGRPVITGAAGYAACGPPACLTCKPDLCAFSTSAGILKWRASQGGAPVAAANGVVYAKGAYDAKTGRRLGSVSGIVANGMVYVYDGSRITAYGLQK